MSNKNLCLGCKVRGLCCYYSCILGEKHNVILTNQACKYLDCETGLCKDYKHRNQLYEHCLTESSMFNTGGLPKECEYLKGHPERELNPKVHLKDVIDNLNYQDILFYTFLNTHPNIQSIYKKTQIEEIVK